uniref:Uncharacterized protein n=1 Tax=Solanum lycopersicum TaxID=4081 RepID=A0A3Q7HXE0_SOLLC
MEIAAPTPYPTPLCLVILHVRFPLNLLERKTRTFRLVEFLNMHGKRSTRLLFPTFRTSNNVQLTSDFGSFPSKIFLLRSKVIRAQPIGNESGITPWSLLFPRFSTPSFGLYSSRHGGIVPLKALLEKSRT